MVDSIRTDNLFFWNLSRCHCEVRASADIVKSLLDRF